VTNIASRNLQYMVCVLNAARSLLVLLSAWCNNDEVYVTSSLLTSISVTVIHLHFFLSVSIQIVQPATELW